jgi:hypothetical protein
MAWASIGVLLTVLENEFLVLGYLLDGPGDHG